MRLVQTAFSRRRTAAVASLAALVALSGCSKKTAVAPPPPAAPTPAQEARLPTVVRYVDNRTPLYAGPSIDEQVREKELPLLKALDVLLPEPGAAPFAQVLSGPAADAKTLGFVLVCALIEQLPPFEDELKAAGDALPQGALDRAKFHAQRAAAIDAARREPLELLATLEAVLAGKTTDAAQKLAALGPAQPRREEPLSEAVPDTGQLWFFAAREGGLRAGHDANAAVAVPLELGTKVRVLELAAGWALAERTGEEPVAAQADAGTEPTPPGPAAEASAADAAAAAEDAGAPPASVVADAGAREAEAMADAGPAPLAAADAGATAPPKSARGWVDVALLMQDPPERAQLLTVATARENADKWGAALHALELALALSSGDDALLRRTVKAAVAAGRFERAVLLAQQVPDKDWLDQVVLRNVFGCRGDRKKAVLLSDDPYRDKGPKDACLVDVRWPHACVACWERNTSRDEERRVSQERKRRDRLRREFPQGPFVLARLPGNLRTPGKVFLYEASHDFGVQGCDELVGSADLSGAELLGSVEAPRGPEGRDEWFATRSSGATEPSSVVGLVVARDETQALDKVDRFPHHAVGSLADLAPLPNAAMPIDDCHHCASCGD